MSTVTVSCKTPNGFVMEVDGTRVNINGFNAKEHGQLLVIEGHEAVGLTHDVPEAFFKKWLEKFKDHPLHTNGLVFADVSVNKVKAETKERKGVKSGMEPIDPAKLPVAGVTTETK